MNTKLTFKQIITAGALAAGAAVLINSILFFLFHSIGFITDDIMIQPNQPLTIVPIIISSLLPSLIGACIFFLFEKYSNKGLKIFNIVAIVLLILSFGNPFFGIPNVTVPYGIALNVMHVVVAFSLLYFLKRAKN
jgi:drug/metabolite transporter (DMT)-like permease